MKIRLLVSISILALGVLSMGKGALASAPDSVGQVQNWPAPVALAEAILKSQKLFGEALEIQGTPSTDLVSGDCATTVFRPHLQFPEPVVDAKLVEDNELTCQYEDKDGELGSLRLDLRKVEITPWGNRASEAYFDRNHLPKPFQVHNDPFALLLYQALKQYAPSGKLEESFICGPFGRICSQSYSIPSYVDGKKSAAYLNCTINTEDGKMYKNRCTFYFPQSELKNGKS